MDPFVRLETFCTLTDFGLHDQDLLAHLFACSFRSNSSVGACPCFWRISHLALCVMTLFVGVVQDSQSRVVFRCNIACRAGHSASEKERYQ